MISLDIGKDISSSWHLYVIRTSARELLQAALKKQGVSTGIHYPVPPHLQLAYTDMKMGKGSFPISEAIHDKILSLPIGPHLNINQAEKVVEAVNHFWQ